MIELRLLSDGSIQLWLERPFSRKGEIDLGEPPTSGEFKGSKPVIVSGRLVAAPSSNSTESRFFLSPAVGTEGTYNG